MRDETGTRIDRVATATIKHGAAIVAGNLVGFAAKAAQIGRFVAPDTAAATDIQTGEAYVLFVTGGHELPINAGAGTLPSGTIAGDRIFINPTTFALARNTGAAGNLALGIVESVDTSRTPNVGLVNMNRLNAFYPVP